MLKLRDLLIAASVALMILFGVLTGATASSGCTPTQKREAKSALDFTQTLCILEHTTEEPAIIATLCAIDAVVVPEIEKFLAAHRTASAREQRPASSASTPAPSAPAPAASSAPPAPKPAPAVSAPPAASSAPANDNATAPKKKHAK